MGPPCPSPTPGVDLNSCPWKFAEVMGHFFLVKTSLNVLKLCVFKPVCVRLCDIKSFCYFRDINKSGIKE